QGAHHRTAPDRIIVYNESQILNLFISSEQQKDYENLARELLTASLDLLLAVVNEDLCSQVSTLLFNEGLENAEIIRRLLLILNEHLNKLIIRLPHSTLSNRDQELLVEWVSTEINTEHLRAYNSEINEILKNTVKFLDLLLDEKLFTDILAIINKIIAADKILNLGNNIVAKFRCLAQPERALPRVTEEEKNRVLSKLSLGVTPYGIMNLTAFPRLLDSFQRIISGSLPEGIPSQNELAYCFFSALSWDKVEKVLAPAELREEKTLGGTGSDGLGQKKSDRNQRVNRYKNEVKSNKSPIKSKVKSVAQRKGGNWSIAESQISHLSLLLSPKKSPSTYLPKKYQKKHQSDELRLLAKAEKFYNVGKLRWKYL
ncbi:27001_t:CDS:2, partial [Racocetra persica]